MNPMLKLLTRRSFAASRTRNLMAVLAIALTALLFTSVATIALGAAVGFNAGFFNPFSTSIAQTIAELPIYSGLEYRLESVNAMLAAIRASAGTAWHC